MATRVTAIAQPVSRIGAIKKFLLAPLSRRNFNRFYEICYQEILGYLYYRKTIGYKITESFADGLRSYQDLALQILHDFLHTKKGPTGTIILDYFKRHALDLSTLNDDEIYQHFSILLRGFVKRALSRVWAKNDPQIGKLRRRIRDVLNTPDFVVKETTENSSPIVYLRENNAFLRKDKPSIPDELLRAIVEKAFNQTTKRNEWCRRVFELLKELPEYANFIEKYRLIETMLAVNREFLSVDNLLVSPVKSTGIELLKHEIAKEREETVKWVQENVIGKYLLNKRIDSREAQDIRAALELYLLDFSTHGETDKIPQYFFHIRADVAQKTYLEKYKYVFETVIGKALDDFKARLKKNSIIRNFGTYLVNSME